MNGLEFALGLLDRLAWPITVLIGLILLRRPLLQLLQQLKTVRYRDFQAEFDQQFRLVQRDFAGLPDMPVQTTQSSIDELAMIAPNAAVLSAWAQLCDTARELLAAHGIEVIASETPYLAVQNQLSDKELITAQEIRTFEDLRRLRNKVAHSEFSVSERQARDYAQLAARLEATLRADLPT